MSSDVCHALYRVLSHHSGQWNWYVWFDDGMYHARLDIEGCVPVDLQPIPDYESCEIWLIAVK